MKFRDGLYVDGGGDTRLVLKGDTKCLTLIGGTDKFSFERDMASVKYINPLSYRIYLPNEYLT